MKTFYKLLSLLAVMALLSSGTPAGATPAITISNPDWDIVITAYGYSDLLLDSRPGFEGREFLSGEWAAAVCFTKSGITNEPTWLEPEFIFPDWLSNSDFDIEEEVGLADPFDPFNSDGFLVLQSVITNDCLRITMTYEMIDTVTGILLGTAPKSAAGAGTNVLSSRYAFKHTYQIENTSMEPISGLKLFQFLHGLETDTAIYDDRDYGGALPDYRYDSTQWGQSFGFDGRSGEIVLHDDVISFNASRMPAAWETGFYGRPSSDDHFVGKPSIGVHLSIEENRLDGTDSFRSPEGRWVSGAQRHDLGDLAPGASVAMDVLLTIQTGFNVAFPGVNVEIRSVGFSDTNLFKVEFEETIGGPVGFRLWKSNTLVPFSNTNCPGPDCDWEQVFVPVIFNPLEPALKWFEPPVDPAAPKCFFIIEPAITPTPAFP